MVSSYTQLLEQRYGDKLDDTAREFIAFAVDGAGRMQAMIRDLLTYSRLGGKDDNVEPLDCGRMLEAAQAQLGSAIAETRATIIAGPLPKILGRRSDIIRLLQNLIGNAIKYRNGNVPRVEITARRQGNEWIFSIRDNGIGIEPEHRERIFRLFQRLHSRDKYPGNGIGLASAKKIVLQHGGRIWVESELGQGSTFFFTLPVAKPVTG